MADDVMPDGIEDQNRLRDWFSRRELDTDSSMANLGEPLSRVTPEALLASSRKLLRMSRNEDDGDDRDSLAFQTFHTPGDMLSNKVAMDQHGVMRKALWKVTNKQGNLDRIRPGLLDEHTDHLIQNAGVAQALEENNIIEPYDKAWAVTRMGEGAIASLDSVPEEARGVNPSYGGFVDLVRSPECYAEDMEVLTETGWLQWPKVQYNRLACLINGDLQFRVPTQVVVHDFEGKLITGKGPYAFRVTEEHRMWVAAPGKEFRIVQMADLWPLRSDPWLLRVAAPGFEPEMLRKADQPDYVNTHTVRVPMSNLTRTAYKGKVYCASIVGGLLYVRTPGNKPFWCGNSLKVGVDLRLARGARIGPGNQLYSAFKDLKTGKVVMLSARDAARSTVAYPGEIKDGEDFSYAIKGGRMVTMPKKDIRYQLLDGADTLSPVSGMIPVVGGVQAMRALMGGKFNVAALPLKYREAPLVVSAADNDGKITVPEALGKFAGAVFSKDGGTVTEIMPSSITVLGPDGKPVVHSLYNMYPGARKTYINNEPLVKVGDAVQPGSVLAKSNFTDDTGKFANGVNLRVAWSADYGYGFEDSFRLSASAAKLLTSQHMYQTAVEEQPDVELSREKFRTLFPGKFTKDQLDKLDENGRIRPGQPVKNGDPLFVGIQREPPAPGNMGRGSVRQFILTWDHPDDGIVSDALATKEGHRVYVSSDSPFQPGDKMALTFGGKGIAAEIVPDEQMPTGEDGKPMQLMLSPLGVYSRNNPGQIIAGKFGKIAAKTGKPIVLPAYPPPGTNFLDMADDALKANGIKDKETIFDPVANKHIPDIGTGVMYVMKMPQTSDSKGKGRGTGAYTLDGVPAKGGDSGSKSWGGMEMRALLGYNASNVLADLRLIKGQQNDDYMRQFKLGQTPAMPGNPMVYDKFKDLIRASGVNIKEHDDVTHIFAMTDQQAKELTGGREIRNPETYSAGTYKPVPGGLFDPELTGNDENGGRAWSFIQLPEPLPNPVMVDPLRRLTGLTGKKLDAIIAGREEYNGKTGADAVADLVSKLDLNQIKETARATIKSGAKSKRDDAVKTFQAASAMLKEGVKPEDFLMTRIPVLPARFRPIIRATDQRHMVNDLNYMYRDLFHAVQDNAQAKEAGMPPGTQADARAAVWTAYKALVGTGDTANEKLEEKGVGGVLDMFLGKGSPKMSWLQRNVIGAKSDFGGLGAISLNPSLRPDQVGIPEEQAWSAWEPMVIRELVQHGLPATRAVDEVQKRTPMARNYLTKVMDTVLINRAPTLHKYSIQAVDPVLVPGATMQMPIGPTGYTHDFDGDVMSFGIPMSQEARAEAKAKMSPRANLLSERDGRPMYLPSQEFHMGAWLMNRAPKAGAPVRFKTWDEADAAEKRGDISSNQAVSIG